MRISAAVFAVSLLVLAIAATNIPPSAAQARVGEIILSPTHAAPGTLVNFEGIGWDLSMPYGICRVDGVPVKIDSQCICNVIVENGIYEPVGTFVVANVAAGTYKIQITVVGGDRGALNLVGSQDFAVDGQAVPEFPSFLIMLPVIFALTILLRREHNRRH